VPARPARPTLDSCGVRRREIDSEQWQPRLWALLIGLTILALYVIAFIVRNDDQIEIDFILFKATVSLIWTLIFILALGMLAGVLASQFYRRRRGKPARDVQG
jgi:uncharacterized integral membrane protein